MTTKAKPYISNKTLLWLRKDSQRTWCPTIYYPVVYLGAAKALPGDFDHGRHRVRMMIPGHRSTVTVCGVNLTKRKPKEVKRTFPIGFREELVIKIDDPQPADWIRDHTRLCATCQKPVEPTSTGTWATCPDFHGKLLPALSSAELSAWMTTKFPSRYLLDQPEYESWRWHQLNAITPTQAYRHLECSIHRSRASHYVIAWQLMKDGTGFTIRFHVFIGELEINAETEPAFKFGLIHPDRSPLVSMP